VLLLNVLAVTNSPSALYDFTDCLLVGARTDAVILAEITPDFSSIFSHRNLKTPGTGMKFPFSLYPTFIGRAF
jgi:hypothetical protein